MADNNAVTLAALAILATCVGGLIWVIKFMFNKLLPMMEKVIQMTAANTKVTRSADTYLRERNGRDIEKHEELLKATQAIPLKMQKIADDQAEALLTGVSKINEQHINRQSVDHMVVKGDKNAG